VDLGPDESSGSSAVAPGALASSPRPSTYFSSARHNQDGKGSLAVASHPELGCAPRNHDPAVLLPQQLHRPAVPLPGRWHPTVDWFTSEYQIRRSVKRRLPTYGIASGDWMPGQRPGTATCPTADTVIMAVPEEA
jgi:hypothetical protein